LQCGLLRSNFSLAISWAPKRRVSISDPRQTRAKLG